MPETEEIPLSPPEVPKNKKILCVCDNGRSRSKYMARALSNLGYEHARVLGIQDRQITTKEKIAAINEHDIILCASGTTKSMVEKFLVKEVTFARWQSCLWQCIRQVLVSLVLVAGYSFQLEQITRP